ncbi:hypothetical protein L0F63_003651, partial [Massospora cicadina]
QRNQPFPNLKVVLSTRDLNGLASKPRDRMEAKIRIDTTDMGKGIRTPKVLFDTDGIAVKAELL